MKRRCDSRYFSHSFGGEHDLIKVAKQGLDAMQSLGATLVPTDTGNPFKQNFKFYDLEQAIKPRTQPQFRVRSTGAACAGICATLMATAAPKLVDGRAKISHHIGTGKAVHSMTAQRIAAKVIEQK